uniref:Calcineurin B-like protein 10 n=1 Tax=Rhizophora mucronata TaxID=61149 RepID=A0A2P2JHF8_RHIMU
MKNIESMDEFLKLNKSIFLLVKQVKYPVKKKVFASLSLQEGQLELFLVDEAIINNCTTQSLEQHKQCLHFIHCNCNRYPVHTYNYHIHTYI